MEPASEQMESPQPMRILTIDGAGLQGVSTLLILDRVMGAIAQENGGLKPKPCDVFDTIAGIGAGAWLAILLGRFRLDVTPCLQEWRNMVTRIAKQPKPKGRIVKQVDRLIEDYNTNGCLFESRPQGARTRHVFVAASQPGCRRCGDITYNIFRSYETSKTAKLPQWLREGPANPSSFKISSAFEVTGTSISVIPECSEEMEISRKISFIDTKQPRLHNITGLALDEMWAIHGSDVPISVVVNIGPGFAPDIEQNSLWSRTGLSKPINKEEADDDLSRLEKEMEHDIKTKLDRVYPLGSENYFRLAPPDTTPFTTEDYSDASDGLQAAVIDFLNEEDTRDKIDELAKRLSLPIKTA